MKLIRNKSDRPRRPHDFYPTPYGLSKKAWETIIMDEQPICGDSDILDAGAGNGVWGEVYCSIFGDRQTYTQHQDIIDGIDIEHDSSIWYDNWYKEDFLSFSGTPFGYDLIIGNPPYSFMEEFVRKSFELLRPHGYIFFLGRLEFLASKKRHLGLFTEFPPKKVYVLSRRPSFFSTNGHKTTDAQDYAMYLWKNNWMGEPELDWLYWDYDKEKDFNERL